MPQTYYSTYSSGTSATLPTSVMAEGTSAPTVSVTATTTETVTVTTTTTSVAETGTSVTQKFSLSTLQKVYKFTDEVIAKYFDEVKGMKTPQYKLKPNCGYSNISDLRRALFEEYQNMLILNNFMSGNVADSTGKETASALKRTSDGKLLTATNYTQYAEEIGKATPEEAEELRKNALNQLIKQFSSGNLAVAQVKTILGAIGVKDAKQKVQGDNYVFTFTYDGKNYSITCNKAAAKSGKDNFVDVRSMLEQELEEYKASEDRIAPGVLGEITDDSDDGVDNLTGRAFKEPVEPDALGKINHEPYVFDESVIARTASGAPEGFNVSDRKEAKTLKGSTVTTTDYDAQNRPVRVTVEKKDAEGNVKETVVTFFEYDGDSKIPSKKVVQTKDSTGTMTGEINTFYRVDGTVYRTYDNKYENGRHVSTFSTDYRADGTVDYTLDIKYGENGYETSSFKTYYDAAGRVARIDEYKLHNGHRVSYLDTNYRADGTVSSTYGYKYNENGSVASSFDTYYRADGTVEATFDCKYDENGKTVSSFDTYYRADGTVYSTYDYKYDENGKKVSSFETDYRADGTKSNTKDCKYFDGKFKPTHVAQFNPDGTIRKEEKWEYDDKGNVTKKITIECKYDDEGDIIKRTTRIDDAVKNTSTVNVEEFEYEESEEDVACIAKEYMLSREEW